MTRAEILSQAVAWANAQLHTHITEQEALGHCRKRRFVSCRRLAMWWLRTERRWSFPEIGRNFQGRDHASVMHLVKRENKARGLPLNWPIEDWAVERDLRIQHDLKVIEQRLRQGENIADIAYQYRADRNTVHAALTIAGVDMDAVWLSAHQARKQARCVEKSRLRNGWTENLVHSSRNR